MVTRIDIGQDNFRLGEIHEQLTSQVNSAAYNNAVLRCRNMHPTPLGALTRRNGTLYVDSITDTNSVKIIPFDVSINQNFLLVLTAPKDNSASATLNVYKDNSSLNLAISTPWKAQDFDQLKYVRSGDIMWLVCPTYPIYTITHYSDTDWQIQEYKIIWDLYDTITFGSIQQNPAPAQVLRSTINRTRYVQDSKIFYGYFAGRLYRIYQETEINGITFTTAFGTATNITFDQRLRTQVRIPPPPNPPPGVTPRPQIVYEHVLLFAIVYYQDPDNVHFLSVVVDTPRNHLNSKLFDKSLYIIIGEEAHEFSFKDIHEETSFSYTMTLWWRGDAVEHAFRNIATTSSFDAIVAAPELTQQYEFPTVIAFHDLRLILASTKRRPQTIWISQKSLFNDFSRHLITNPTTQAVSESEESRIIIIPFQKYLDKIQWILPIEQALLIGSENSIFALISPENTPLTVSNYTIRVIGDIGCASIDPIYIPPYIVYVSFTRKSLYAISYSENIKGYRSQELSLIAEHLLIPKIKNIAKQHESNHLIWCLLDDGTLANCFYLREQDSVGWAAHNIGLNVSQISSLRTNEQDVVYMIVERVTQHLPSNPTSRSPTNQAVSILSKRTAIEMLPGVKKRSLTQAVYLDSVVYKKSATSFTTPFHNEEVIIVKEGDFHRETTLVGNNKTITLDKQYDHVFAGIPYTSEVFFLNQGESELGAWYGKSQRTISAVIKVHQSFIQGTKVGETSFQFNQEQGIISQTFTKLRYLKVRPSGLDLNPLLKDYSGFLDLEAINSENILFLSTNNAGNLTITYLLRRVAVRDT